MRDVGGNEVDVQLQRIRTSLRHLLRVIDPAALGHAVQAGDDRNLQRLLRLADVLQVFFGSKVVVTEVGIVALRLGRNVRRLPQIAIEFVALDHDLLFKQRFQHHRGRTGIFQFAQVARSLHSGEDEATSGFFSFSPRYFVERSIIRSSLAQRFSVAGFASVVAAGPGIAARYS